MRKNYYVCVAFIIISVFLNMCGCDSRDSEKPKKIKRTRTPEEMLERGAEFELSHVRHIIALLSCKYSIPSEAGEKLLKDYIKNEELLSRASRVGEENLTKNYLMMLEKLSTQHAISKEKLSSLIIDYRLLNPPSGSLTLMGGIEYDIDWLREKGDL